MPQLNLQESGVFVVLADKIDWVWLGDDLAGCFYETSRPAEPVRFMIGMFLLKHTYTQPDEEVWERWGGEAGSSNRAKSAAARSSESCAVGTNMRLILKWLRKLLRKIIAAVQAGKTPFLALEPAC